MDRETKLRRVVIVSEIFTRNLAYYRAGWNDGNFIRNEDIWITTNGNFLDICVLEWCKLFGDKNDKHHWRKVYKDHKEFRQGMFSELRINQTKLDQTWGSIRSYRDSFVAHLDHEKTMKVPKLDLAQQTLGYYHGKIVLEAKGTNILNGRVTDLDGYYKASLEQAKVFYEK